MDNKDKSTGLTAAELLVSLVNELMTGGQLLEEGVALRVYLDHCYGTCRKQPEGCRKCPIQAAKQGLPVKRVSFKF